MVQRQLINCRMVAPFVTSYLQKQRRTPMSQLSLPARSSAEQPLAPPSPAELRHLISGLDTRVDFAKLTDRTPFAQVGADSLDFFNIILAVENAFGIRPSDEEVSSLNTIDGMVQYLTRKLSA
jgi:acyl carrier protein